MARKTAKESSDRIYTEYMRLDDFIQRMHEQNPKGHDDDMIRNSIGRFGFVEQPTIDERTGKIAAGHGRATNLWTKMNEGGDPPKNILVDEDGMWMLPVTRGVSFNSDDELKAYLVISNQATIAGGWDLEKLEELYHSLDADLQALTGFGDDIFGELMGMEEGQTVDFSEFEDVTEAKIKYRVVIEDFELEEANKLADLIRDHSYEPRVEQYRVKDDPKASLEGMSPNLADTEVSYDDGDLSDFDTLPELELEDEE